MFVERMKSLAVKIEFFVKYWYFKLRNRPYSEFYANYMESSISKRNFKNAIGGKWEEIGKLQTQFLIEKGLKPDHILFDFGCGSLRGGQHLIKYLNKNNYYGCDISYGIIEAAKEIVENDSLLQSKSPTLIYSPKINLAEAGVKYDYIIAQSVFTHMPLSDIELVFSQLEGVLSNKGKMYATYFQAYKERMSFKKTNFYYPFEELKKLGEKYNLVIEEAPYKHPRSQRMLEIGVAS